MFPLCKTCTDTLNQNPCTHTDEERAILGTWCHVELMNAIEKGYQVLEIHEVWHWEETTDQLFSPYVNLYLKRKQEASGYPKHCVTDEQKQQYIDEYYEHEGIRLDPNNIEYNPGLRFLAKLMLNSLWGTYLSRKTLVSSRAWDCSEKQRASQGLRFKSGMRDFSTLTLHPSQHPHFHIFYRKICTAFQPDQNRIGDRSQQIVRVIVFRETEVPDIRLVNAETVEVQFKSALGFEESNDKVNIVIAAFTTAYARLKLYDLLDQLQEQVLYYDTDSVIYVHEPGKPEPPLGDYLGDLTDELDGDYITEFMAGGPKNYAYVTNNDKRVMKVRGITLNYATLQKLNFEAMRDLIDLYVDCGIQDKVTVDNPFQITRDKKNKKIITKGTKKDYQIVYNKRVVKENYGTVPYGY